MRSIKELPISDIEVPKSRAKKVDLDTDGGDLLVQSIQRQGILHPPLVQPPAGPGGKYRLVFGQRRFAVAKKLKLATIRVTVDDKMTDDEVEWAILAENLLRKGDKSPAERRKALRRWWELHKAALEAAGKDDAKASPRGAAVHRNGQGVAKNGNGQPNKEEEAEEEEVEISNGARRAPFENGESEPEEDAGQEPEAPEITDTSFRRKIQDATGCSRRKAHYDSAVAKAFTEDQLTVIDSLELSEEAVRQLAAVKDETERNTALYSISMGKDPQEAIQGARKLLDNAKKAVKSNDEDLSDGDWLVKYCGTIRPKLTNLKAFDTSALLYRRSRLHLKALKVSTDRDMRNARLEKANDPLTYLMTMLTTLRHPDEWLVCGICSGTGSDGNGSGCRTCNGAGFKMQYGGGASK